MYVPVGFGQGISLGPFFQDLLFGVFVLFFVFPFGMLLVASPGWLLGPGGFLQVLVSFCGLLAFRIPQQGQLLAFWLCEFGASWLPGSLHFGSENGQTVQPSQDRQHPGPSGIRGCGPESGS